MLSVLLLGLKVQRRVRRLFGKAPGPSLVPTENRETKSSTPRLASSKKTSRWKWHPSFVWLILAALAVPLLLFGRAQLHVSGPFNILPRENTDVRAAVEGIVQQVYVDEGSEVKSGDLIARLSDVDQVALLKQVETDILAKQAHLRMLQAGTRPEEIEAARQTVDTSVTKHETAVALYNQAKHSRDERLTLAETGVRKAEERVEFGEKTLATYRALQDQGLGSRLQVDQAAEESALRKRELEEARSNRQVVLAEDLADTARDVAVSEKEMKEAHGKLAILEAGARKEEVEALQADLQHSQAEKAALQEQIDRTQVFSPTAGIVATPSRILKEMPRQLVKKGDLIAKIFDFKAVTAQIVVPEKEIAEVRVGQPVSLRVRAYPNETFRGVVTSIATAALSSSGGGQPDAEAPASAATADVKNIVVTTEIDNRDLLLKPEMTGQAKIFCGSERILDLVSRRVARTVKVEFWSWW
jgi:multidrug resistance efflux pump